MKKSNFNILILSVFVLAIFTFSSCAKDEVEHYDKRSEQSITLEKSVLHFSKTTKTDASAFFSALASFNPIHPISNINEWIALPYMTEHFYSSVNNKVDEMLERIWKQSIEDIRLTENTVYVPFAIYDHKVLLAVPFDVVQQEGNALYTLRKANNINSSASRCSGCSGSCKRKSANYGLVVYCDGCDSGCTLHTER